MGPTQDSLMDQRDPKTGKEHREFFNIDLSSGWETIAPGIEAKTLAGSLDEGAGKGHINRLARWHPMPRSMPCARTSFTRRSWLSRERCL